MSISNNVTIQIRRGLKSELPSSAAVGEPLFCTDTNELFIGAGLGNPLVSLSSGTVIPVTNPNTTWTITHNLGKRPSVTVVNSSGEVIFCDVLYENENQITITLSVALTGSVYLN
jgi:hypothetical protein